MYNLRGSHGPKAQRAPTWRQGQGEWHAVVVAPPFTRYQACVSCWEKFFDAPSAALAAGLQEVRSEAEEGDNAHSAVFQGPPRGYVIDLPDGVESRLRYRRASPAEFRVSARWDLEDPT